MTTHPVRWQSPQPLWTRFGSDAAAAAASPEQARPAILRFASDDFMDQMLATLERDPSCLGSLLARPETWRQPGGGSPDLIARTPVPRLAQASARASAMVMPKPRIAPIAATPASPLKLYQPAHQRHYLVGASLVCAQQGLPERAVVQGGAEQVNFVIRRLLPATKGAVDASLHEYAFVKDADGARWLRVGAPADAQRAVAGEDLLPLFPLAYRDDLAAARTLWTGSVPVGRREEYMGTTIDRAEAPGFAVGQRQSMTPQSPSRVATVKLGRVTQFQMEVAEPWKTQIRSSFKIGECVREEAGGGSGSESADAKSKRVFEFNLQQQNVSWLILLDLADFIETHLPDLWTVILNDGAGASELRSPLRRRIHTYLAGAAMSGKLVEGLRLHPGDGDVKRPAATLRDALKAIRKDGVRQRLEAVELNYDSANSGDAAWPDFHFVLAGLSSLRMPAGPYEHLSTLDEADPEALPPEPELPPAPGSPSVPKLARAAADKVDRLTALVGLALDDVGDATAPPLPYALQLKNALMDAVNDPGWFVIRFVYSRRDCGPLHPPLLSAATERFQLASFFDAEAPARPIRITLPTDTSPAGLRKFNKGTAFVLSDMLCGQVQRAKGLGFVDLVRAVLPWPLHKDLDGTGGSCQSGGINIGMICSLSIPIITICALIVLIIMVTLLDMIFRWLPFFVMCFPLPRFKGKKG